MATFVGIILFLAFIVLVLQFVRFLFRIGRHAAQDVSEYARHQNPTVEQSRARHREVTTGKPQFTQAERDYLAAHVPASARRAGRKYH